MDNKRKVQSTSRFIKWLLILSPFLISLFSSMACLIPYYITVYYIGLMKNYKLNFISIYSNPIPSSGFFSLFLSLTNYFLFFLILFQYLCLKSLNYISCRVKFVNLFSFLIGLLSILSSLVLQSFHIHTNRQIHYVASIGTLITMLAYIWFQTFLTFMVRGSWILLTFRFLISTSATSLLVACSLYTDAIYQWICIFMILMFFITFIPEMINYEFCLNAKKIKKKLTIKKVQDEKIDDFDDDDDNNGFDDMYGSQPYRLNQTQPHQIHTTKQVFSTYV